MNNQHNETPPKNEPREYEAEEEVLTDTGAIDAGTVTDLDQNPPEVKAAAHRAKTASKLAYVLVGILGASIVLHYAAVLVLSLLQQQETADALSEIFDKWLPVIASFVGGAVTYYFTREK